MFSYVLPDLGSEQVWHCLIIRWLWLQIWACYPLLPLVASMPDISLITALGPGTCLSDWGYLMWQVTWLLSLFKQWHCFNFVCEDKLARSARTSRVWFIFVWLCCTWLFFLGHDDRYVAGDKDEGMRESSVLAVCAVCLVCSSIHLSETVFLSWWHAWWGGWGPPCWPLPGN